MLALHQVAAATRSAEPSEDLRQAVHSLVASAAAQFGGMEPDIVDVTFTSSNQKVDNWEARKVGTQDLTVVAKAPATYGSILNTIMNMLEESKQERTAAAEREAVLAAQTTRNTAAQILLHAAGKASFRVTTTDYYAKLGSSNAGVQQVASALLVPAEQFVQHADQVISRRNAATHFGSLAELDKHVQEVRGLITPKLQAICRWECAVIEQYDAIKLAFAVNFC